MAVHCTSTWQIPDSNYAIVKVLFKPDAKESSIFNFVLFGYNPPAMNMSEEEEICLKRPFTNANVRSVSNRRSIQTRRYTIK
jgi:hypothetical protein